MEMQYKVKAEPIDLDNLFLQTEEQLLEAIEKNNKAFTTASSNISTYSSALAEFNTNGAFSSKTLQDLANDHENLLPYLNDEAELYEQLQLAIQEEERIQQEAYTQKMMLSESFFTNTIKGQDILQDKLGEYYTEDLENVKNLADAKERVESELIKTLSSKWGDYYDIETDAFNEKYETLKRMAISGDSIAAQKLVGVMLDVEKIREILDN
jgi:hypothetical protein